MILVNCQFKLKYHYRHIYEWAKFVQQTDISVSWVAFASYLETVLYTKALQTVRTTSGRRFKTRKFPIWKNVFQNSGIENACKKKLKLSDRYCWMSVLRLELDVRLSLFFILSSKLSITNIFQYLQQYNWENKLDVCVTKSHSQNIQPKGWV